MNGSITEEMQGEELHAIVRRHWRMGIASGVRFHEGVTAAKMLGVPLAAIKEAINVIDRERGYNDPREDVMENYFVPEENVAKVCELLDQIQGLCVSV